MNSVNVVECFPSFQGEGPDTGKRSLILRFKNCNRQCVWCDTIKKMEESKEFSLMVGAIQSVIDHEKCGLLITGGEPTFNSPANNNLDQTLLLLRSLIYPFANVETNGYALEELVLKIDIHMKRRIRFIYSPKLFTDKDLDQAMENIDTLQYASNVFLKIVCDPSLDLISNFLEHISKYSMHERVYLMPEGTSRDVLLKNATSVLKIANHYKFNFSSREHIIYDFV